MIVAIFVFAAIALCVLLILVALVSVASRREDRAWTLTEPASRGSPGLSRAGSSACTRATLSGFSGPAARTGAAWSGGQSSSRWEFPTTSAIASGWRRARPGDTYPLSANQRADSAMASRAGREV